MVGIIVKCVGRKIWWYVSYRGICGLLILEALFDKKPYLGCFQRFYGEKLMRDGLI
jgi:hypothetical protein